MENLAKCIIVDYYVLTLSTRRILEVTSAIATQKNKQVNAKE